MVTLSCKPSNCRFSSDETVLLSAFCQKPVPGLRNLPIGGISPNLVWSVQISNKVMRVEMKAKIFIRQYWHRQDNQNEINIKTKKCKPFGITLSEFLWEGAFIMLLSNAMLLFRTYHQFKPMAAK